MSITLNTKNSFHFHQKAIVPEKKCYDPTIYTSIEIIKTIIREKINGYNLYDKIYFLEGRTGSGKSTFLVSELFKNFILNNDLQKDSIIVVEPKVILTQSNALNIVKNNNDIELGKDIGYISSRLKVYPKNKKNISMMTTEIFKQKYLNAISKKQKIASIVIIDEVHILDIPMISLLNVIYNSINQENISILPLFIFASATIDIDMLTKYFSKHINLSIKEVYENYSMIGYVTGKRNFDVKQYFINEKAIEKMSFEHMSNWIYNSIVPMAIKSPSKLKYSKNLNTNLKLNFGDDSNINLNLSFENNLNTNSENSLQTNYNENYIPCRDILIFFPITKYFDDLNKALIHKFKENSNKELENVPVITVNNKTTKTQFYMWRNQNRNKLRFVILYYASGYSPLSEELLKYAIDPDHEANMNEIKIILSTPAIETGKTISTLYVVIDTGLQFAQIFKPLTFKQNEFYGHLQPISKNAAIQRNGRVGREAEGLAFAYYTKNTYDKMDLNQLPENINLISVAGIYIDNFKVYSKYFTGDYVKDRLDLIYTNDYIVPNSIDTLIKTGQDLINILYLSLNGDYTNFNNFKLKVDNWLIYAKYLYYLKGFSLFNSLYIARLNRKYLTTYLTPNDFKYKYGLDTIKKYQEQSEELKKEILEAITEAKRITNIHKYFKNYSPFIEI